MLVVFYRTNMIIRQVLLQQITRSVKSPRNHIHKSTMAGFSDHNLTFSLARFAHRDVKCWQCGIERKNVGDLFCDKCKYIQSPSDKSNYFKVFELPEQFDIDQKQLTNKYRQMQSQLHPDKFSTKSDEEKIISEEFSSLVNKAYKTLQQPLNRAVHLLHLSGGVIEEGQKVDDPDFLMEIMELNEEVEDATSEEALAKLKQKNDARLARIGSEISADFAAKRFDKAKESIIKMKYYHSVAVHIDRLLRDKVLVQ